MDENIGFCGFFRVTRLLRASKPSLAAVEIPWAKAFFPSAFQVFGFLAALRPILAPVFATLAIAGAALAAALAIAPIIKPKPFPLTVRPFFLIFFSFAMRNYFSLGVSEQSGFHAGNRSFVVRRHGYV